MPHPGGYGFSIVKFPQLHGRIFPFSPFSLNSAPVIVGYFFAQLQADYKTINRVNTMLLLNAKLLRKYEIGL